MAETVKALMEGMSDKASSFTSATHCQARSGNVQGVCGWVGVVCRWCVEREEGREG